MDTRYLRHTIRESAGNILREFRILVKPAPRPAGCWLFLAGCYNSGTTLLAKLLAQHADISAIPTEGHFITNQFVKDFEVGLPRMWAAGEHLFRLTEDSVGPDPERVKKEWGIRLDTGKRVLLEKSPPNTARTRWLQRHCVPARFVAIVRDGYAVAEGIRRKADPKHLPQSWPIEDCARQWVRSYEVLLEDAPNLEHLLWVRYEDLARNPLETLNEIARFAGLPPFPDMKLDSPLSVHERDEPMRNMNEESISRLSGDDLRKITVVAGPMLEHFGYPLRP